MTSPDKSPATRKAYAHDHACEAEGCTNLSPTSRTCSNACRAKVWKSEHNYVERRRGVRNASQGPRTRRQTRYLICRRVGHGTFAVAGTVTARSRRAAERTAGIADDPKGFVFAASHLPKKELSHAN